MVRPTSQLRIKHPYIEKVTGDICDRKSFEDTLKGVDKIYHLAAVVTDWAPRSLYEMAHINGTRNILEAAIIAGVRKIVHISTIDVSDHDNHPCIDENTEYTSSRSPYRYTKVQAEKLVLAFCQEKGTKAVIIRPSWVYGPGDSTFLPEIVYRIRRGDMIFIGNPKNSLPLVYVDNLAWAIIKAGEIEAVNGEIFLISDIEITWREFIDRITLAVNGRKTRLCLPYPVAYFVGLMMEGMARISSKETRPLLTRTVVELIGRPIRVNTEKSERILGYKPFISFDEGIKNAIQWLQTFQG